MQTFRLNRDEDPIEMTAEQCMVAASRAGLSEQHTATLAEAIHRCGDTMRSMRDNPGQTYGGGSNSWFSALYLSTPEKRQAHVYFTLACSGWSSHLAL